MTRVLILLFFASSISVYTQQTETKMGPVLENFGQVYQIEKPDLLLKKDKAYKVIFDIYTDRTNGEKINPLINTVARFLNMHAQQGVSTEHMNIAVVIHGAATKNVLSDIAYEKQFNTKNPNSVLLHALKEANVAIFVCGQSFLANGFKLGNKSGDVKLALSALTALVEYQSEGYKIINFN